MVPASPSVSRQRSERRIAVRLPMQVRGCDSRGVAFEEETSSENLCRSGAAFLTRFDLAVGSHLEIRIPLANAAWRASARRFGVVGSNGRSAFTGPGDRFALPRNDSDFATQGRVVHVADAPSLGEKLVGVHFTGPRFQRMFRSESAAEPQRFAERSTPMAILGTRD